MHQSASDKMASVWPRLHLTVMERMRKLKVKDKHLHSLLERLLQMDVENPLSAGKFAFFYPTIRQYGGYLVYCVFYLYGYGFLSGGKR